MAIPLDVPGYRRCRLAQPEQRSAMAQLVVNRVIVAGTVWPRVGLLSLPSIFAACALGRCASICLARRRGVVSFFTQEPLTFNTHIVCRPCFQRAISAS